MNGLTWLTEAADISLPEYMLEHGHDVWLANSRGVSPCMAHKKLDPIEDAVKFFDYSWAEMGAYDTPAML